MTESGLTRDKPIVIQLTEGGRKEGYVLLREHLGFFPGDAIGAPNEQDGSGTQLTLRFAGSGETVQTDIADKHMMFRRRAPWRRFFAHHGLVEGDSVAIERRSADGYEYDVIPLAGSAASNTRAATPGREWSMTEVTAIVADYLAMLSAEAAGQPYSKADHRRELQGKLNPGRTPQAIEYKHANISAVMIDLGLPYIRGYKPRGNYQAELASEIRRCLADRHLLAALRAMPATAPAHGLQPTEPPRPVPRKRTGRHVDYGLLQDENRKLGALGEQLVVAFEEQRLRQSGRTDLAGRVRWVSRDDGDGLGYDIFSFDASGNERHIEVKTTALGAQTPFYISSAELEFARSHPDSFALYRVYDATENPKFYALEGDITLAVDLVPVTYRAQLASSPETTYGEALPTITPEDFP